LSPCRVPSPSVLAPMASPGSRSPAPTRPPAPPATQPAATQPASTQPAATQPAATVPASGSGYTLVLMWCPFCKNNLIDNRDFECYTCEEKRYYRSLEYEDD
jgi:hypothetical protein